MGRIQRRQTAWKIRRRAETERNDGQKVTQGFKGTGRSDGHSSPDIAVEFGMHFGF
jgi:hypothetical protein